LYTFRRAAPADALQLAEFECHNPNEKWTLDVERAIRRGVAEEVAEGQVDGCVHLALFDEEIVGVIVHLPVVDDPLQSVISALAVTHPHRRRGVATALKSEVMAECAKEGMTSVVSEVHRRNSAMANLNTKLGISSARNPEDGEYNIFAALLP
jgi:GNAT superfamily N-acetyltransferase